MSLLVMEGDGEPHSCEQLVENFSKPRPDLADTPLPNSDLVYFVDGSAQRDRTTGEPLVAYAVCSAYYTVESGRLPSHLIRDFCSDSCLYIGRG
ncbi:hypothetical protein AAFF_G00249830 [Aldrovandia affinis]|uniref:Uncharacterized protein n=1 Tax=Aldrovandia affinis TaxID=143900 RepID=A0AAD7RD66_9TELE|nr:hypothetical protein AAFF_G00249830 [Aldrovandia affinis]